ncbi:MAG: sensor histidine kinase, partial [Bacteroidia bacterium]
AYEKYVVLNDSLSSEKTKKEALEKAFAYDIEKKQNENLLLSQRNAIQKLQINQSNVILLGAAGVFLVLLVILFLYKRQVRYRAEFLQLQSEQRLLRSQMNPHFIFNSLNAIKQFVMLGRNQEAELYLSKFSKLIRNLLERSMEENIRVSEEMEILNGYLEMESLRFEDSFQYELSCDESTEFKNFRIPQSMLQPLVENAIWHGLLPKENDRKVTISLVRNSEKTIQCTIDDNGVGRKEVTKPLDNHKSKSLAIHFIQQRLSRMRPSDKVVCRMQIIDKHDSTGNSLGTKVVIVLPILN